MTIHIPDSLIDKAAWLILAIGVLMLAILTLTALCRLVCAALQARHYFWCAVVWLCTKQQRDNAKKWTASQFRSLRRKLEEEDPKFLAQIRSAIND